MNKQKQTKTKILLLLLIMPLIILNTISAETQEQELILNNMTPQNNTTTIYEHGKLHLFTTTWTNSTEIIKVTINHNFTETNTNEVLTSIELEEELEYLFAIELSAGNYTWNMTAETENETMTTPQHIYTVQKAQPNITLIINNQTQNTTENITINETNNLTLIANIKNLEGILKLWINDELKNTTENLNETNTINRTIQYTKTFNEPGIYNVKATYNETQNYTYEEKNLTIIVLEKEINMTIETDKEQYTLGEEAKYLIRAPDYSEIEIKICRNTTLGNLNWRECTPTQSIQNEVFPILFSHYETKKPGIYEIEAIIKNTTIKKIKTYEVLDSIILTTTGKTKLKVNEETTLKATTTGGIAPYTYKWTLPNSTIKTGNELKIKYLEEGNKNIKIEVQDLEGNKKEQIIKLEIREYYDLTIEVRNQQNQIIKDAIVTVLDLNENKLTDNTGKAKFNLEKNEYDIRINAEEYTTKTQKINLDKTTTLTIKLDTKTTTTSTGTEKIQIEKPQDKARITNTNVEFQAKINIEEPSICKLFIADKNSQWFAELSRQENIKTETITFNEKIEIGEYKWKISCENTEETTETEIRELSIVNEQTIALQTTQANTIDAGELRRKIETAHDNLDNLDLNSRRAADALDMQEALRITLRDYERILRDINSLALRRDLTETQKQEKLQEYKELIQELEIISPLSMKVHKSEEFVAYPNKEELEQIATQYLELRNLQGRIDKKELETMQNLLRTRTYTAQVTITYLNGETKDITLIHKNIEYTGETTRNHFILESIPQPLRKEITIKQTHDIIQRNEIIRFEKPETITYYTEGHQDLEEVKKTNTILLTEGIYQAGNTKGSITSITGMISLANAKIEPTTGLVIILIILILAYILYAFDIKEKIKNAITGFNKNKKLQELKILINDAKDYLEAQNIERANLIYKEIKMIYEKSSHQIKNEIYEETTSLVKLLNEKYLEYLITKTHEEIKNKQISEAIKTYNKLTEAYNKSEQDTQKSLKEQILKLNKEIKEQQK